VNGIVLDASVTLSWCFPDEQTSLSLKVLDRLKAGEAALVPAFWPLEILCHFNDKFAEMNHILAAPAVGSPLFRQDAGCGGETVQA
jgi:hypothetical protein